MTDLAPLPDVQADERTTLRQFLDYYRSVLLRKSDGLTEAQSRHRVGASTLDMIGLVRHMAMVEFWWFSTAFEGSDAAPHWDDPDDPDIDFHPTASETLEDARAQFVIEVERARACEAQAATLDALTAIDVGPLDVPDRRGKRSLRWIMVHMIEEYARHCGHADLIREDIDGAVED